jgi:hypothetical protein
MAGNKCHLRKHAREDALTVNEAADDRSRSDGGESVKDGKVPVGGK